MDATLPAMPAQDDRSGQVELFHPLPAALQTPKRHACQGLDQCRSATDPPSTSSTALPSAAGISPVDPIAPSRILQEHHEINHVGSPVESTRHFFKNASEKRSNAGSKMIHWIVSPVPEPVTIWGARYIDLPPRRLGCEEYARAPSARYGHSRLSEVVFTMPRIACAQKRSIAKAMLLSTRGVAPPTSCSNRSLSTYWAKCSGLQSADWLSTSFRSATAG